LPKKLVNSLERNHEKRRVEVLTTQKPRPFIVSFELKLERGFTFFNLQQQHLKQLQNFLDNVSVMEFGEVEKIYKCKSDKKDTYRSQQIIHFKVADSFRIHGIIIDGRFAVLRLDPNHRVH
jgi:hypothetical protein